MKRLRRRLLSLMVLWAVAGLSMASPDGLRPWTVSDSIGLRYFVSDPELARPPGFIGGTQDKDRPVSAAPDGKHLFFVTFRGDLARDCVAFTLHVFATADVVRSLARGGKNSQTAAKHTVDLCSSQPDALNAGAIFAPYWESNDSIVFVGSRPQEAAQVYRLSISSGELRALRTPQPVARLFARPSFALRGESMVFQSEDYVPWTPLDRYPAATLQSDELMQLFQPKRMRWRTYVMYRGGTPQLVASAYAGAPVFLTALSPDEQWAVIVAPLEERPIPAAWQDYERKSTHGYRFCLIDTAEGTMRDFFDAPAGTVTQAGRDRLTPFDAFWSRDSRSVVLYNTTLPLDEDRSERQRMSYVVSYSIDTRAWSILEPMADGAGRRVASARWEAEGRVLSLAHEMQDHLPAAATMFAYDGDRWNALPVSRAAQRAASRDNSPRRDVPSSMSSTAPFASSPLPFKVGIRQGPNDPPRMMASRDARETVLTTGGTVPEGVKIGRAERIEWLGSDGKPDSALLMLPEDSGAAQSRLPLVIQLGEDTSRDFRPEGSAFGFFAAQSLVAKGFAVVQLHAFDDRNAVLNLHEGPRIVQRVDALVAMLEGRGWVDAKRVGLVGFSRSGYHVYYVITHPARTRIAAAAVFDSITASYGEYVISAAAYADGSASVYEKQYGTGTFWQNKTEWMDAPAFNLERSMTPVLFSATSEQYPLGALETLGAFRITERPIEYLYFPNAAHELQSPAQRELAQRTSIDWLSFWMQGRENMEAPMEQRVRWRNMRERWNRKLAEAAP